MIPRAIGVPILNQWHIQRFMLEGDTLGIVLLEPGLRGILHPPRALAEPAVRQAAPSAHFMWTNICCLSEYWTDRFPREPRQKVKPSERCDHERNGKQERPQLTYHNQGTNGCCGTGQCDFDLNVIG